MKKVIILLLLLSSSCFAAEFSPQEKTALQNVNNAEAKVALAEAELRMAQAKLEVLFARQAYEKKVGKNKEDKSE